MAYSGQAPDPGQVKGPASPAFATCHHRVVSPDMSAAHTSHDRSWCCRWSAADRRNGRHLMTSTHPQPALLCTRGIERRTRRAVVRCDSLRVLGVWIVGRKASLDESSSSQCDRPPRWHASSSRVRECLPRQPGELARGRSNPPHRYGARRSRRRATCATSGGSLKSPCKVIIT